MSLFFAIFLSFAFLNIVAGDIILKEGCQTKCGEVTIVPPFGIGKGCYLSPYYEVICDTSLTPLVPRLSESSGYLEVTNMTQENLRVIRPSVANCYNNDGEWEFGDLFSNPILSYSPNLNVFMVFGCNVFAYIPRAPGSTDYVAGCSSLCTNATTIGLNSCDGTGCCMSSIPKGMQNYSWSQYALNVNKNVLVKKACTRAFIVEKEFVENAQFNVSLLSSNLFGFDIPQVYEFVIDGTCEEVQKGVTSSACQDYSSCFNVNNGYRCRCMEGFEGNPYEPGGCRDIDECRRSPCVSEARCENQVGSYECVCPIFYSGDGTADGSGCMSDLAPIIAVLIIASSGALVWYLITLYIRHRRLKNEEERRRVLFVGNGGLKLQNKVRIFTEEDVNIMTNNFHEDRKLGGGAPGGVYKGMLPEGTVVAVKVCNTLDEELVEQFVTEVSVLSQTNNKNIVRLFGCCLHVKRPVVVYEFVSNITLSHLLHGGIESIPWLERIRIARELAAALKYLHWEANETVLHRDIMPENVLLTESRTVKLCDFGLTKNLPDGLTRLATIDIGGTFGYLDRGLFKNPIFRRPNEVYSFGSVMLEILRRQKAVTLGDDFREHLLNLPLNMVVDNNEPYEGLEEILRDVLRLAHECIKTREAERPTMMGMWKELERIEQRIRNAVNCRPH